MAAHGRHFLVEPGDQPALSCVTKGKKGAIVCGDVVEIQILPSRQGIIERALPRSSLFFRSDTFKTKPIAANATQVAVVLASRPSWSEDLLQRCLIAAESQQLPVLVIANKSDLPEHLATLAALSPYAAMGYRIVSLSALSDASTLLPYLSGHLTLLTGQSGMGKSTLLNQLIPAAAARINSFSEALDSGKHTTSDTRLYRLDKNTAVMDSPGFQEFALAHLNQTALESAMPDFRPYLGQCRFRNCSHQHEPGCAILQAAEAEKIDRRRLAFFQRVLVENTRNRLY